MSNRLNISNLKRGISYLKRNGLSSAYVKVTERLSRDKDEENYTEIVKASKLSSGQIIEQRNAVFDNPCLISILVPAYNPDEDAFVKLLESVAAQTYTNWELIIADAGTDPKTQGLVKDFASRHGLDPKGRYDNADFYRKVIYNRLEKNRGISLNTNEALKLAKGAYIALLDHDDELTEDALFEVISVINKKSHLVSRKSDDKCRIIYSDEDKVSYDNNRYFDWHRKYDYDPVMLLTNNYICHLTVVETALARNVGGFDSDYDGSQDFDFVLRCFEQVKETEIAHIPKVLYHWRSSKSSTAENPNAKLYAYEAGKRAVKNHLKRAGIEAKVENTAHLGFFKVDFPNATGSIYTISQQKFEMLNEASFNAISEEFILVLSEDLSGCAGFENSLRSVMILPEVGASTGKIIRGKVIESAGYNRDNGGGISPCFRGLNRNYSGYLHRASIMRCVDAYDRGCVLLKKSALKWNGDGPVLKEGFRCVYVPEAVFKRNITK